MTGRSDDGRGEPAERQDQQSTEQREDDTAPKAQARYAWERLMFSEHGPGDKFTRLVCAAIASHGNRHTLDCYVSLTTLAHETGMTPRAVWTHVQKAHAEGWIWRTVPKRGAGYGNGVYILTLPDKLQGVAPDAIPEGVAPGATLKGGGVAPDDTGCSTGCIQTVTTTSKAKPKARFALPDDSGIDLDAWQGFEEMRKRIRKPMTDHARQLIVAKLAKLKAEGHDPNAVLAQSIEHSSAGVFPLKADSGSKPKRNPFAGAI